MVAQLHPLMRRMRHWDGGGRLRVPSGAVMSGQAGLWSVCHAKMRYDGLV